MRLRCFNEDYFFPVCPEHGQIGMQLTGANKGAAVIVDLQTILTDGDLGTYNNEAVAVRALTPQDNIGSSHVSFTLGDYSINHVVQPQPNKDLYLGFDVNGRAVVVKKTSALLQSLEHELLSANHPWAHHIVLPLKTIIEAEGEHWSVFDMADASLEKLDHFIDLPFALVCQFVIGLMRGLSVFHHAGYIHGDIKQDNLVIKNGKILLIDYASAELIGNNCRTLNQYMYVPEQVNKLFLATTAVDIAAAGCMIYALCTGDLPQYHKARHELMHSGLVTSGVDFYGVHGTLLNSNEIQLFVSRVMKNASRSEQPFVQRFVDAVLNMLNRNAEQRPSALQTLAMLAE